MAFKRGRSTNRRTPRGESDVHSSSDEAKDQPRLLTPEKMEQRARNILLHQLGRSAKSSSQLRKILEEREIPDSIADAAITRFTEVGLIDDAAFAEVIVNSRRTIKGLAKSAIKRELTTKGLAAEIIESAVENLTSEDDLESAKQLALKRFRQMQHLDRAVRHRRLAAFLQRKGYGSIAVFDAIRFAESEFEEEARVK